MDDIAIPSAGRLAVDCTTDRTNPHIGIAVREPQLD
jgi:hypothetical protein